MFAYEHPSRMTESKSFFVCMTTRIMRISFIGKVTSVPVKATIVTSYISLCSTILLFFSWYLIPVDRAEISHTDKKVLPVNRASFVTVDFSQPAVSSYFRLIVQPVHRIARELDARRFDRLGSLCSPPRTSSALSSLFQLPRALKNRDAVNSLRLQG